MAPEVLLRKLAYLRQLLADLEVYRDATTTEVERDHYVIERILELLVVVASDLLMHLLAEQGVQTASYRDTFEAAGTAELITPELAESLAQAAGMRNIIAHMYESINYSILHASIPQALDDFAALVAAGEALLRDLDG